MQILSALLLAILAVSFIHGRSVQPEALNKADPVADTHFLLWTRENRTQQYELKTNDTQNLAASTYSHKKPTKIFAHGWRMNGYNSEAVIEMRNAFLESEDCNFISVDWEHLASNLRYDVAAGHTEPVGQLTGELVKFLIAQGSLVSNFHIIGFSLGAHVAGNAGALLGGKVPRITGLDPAYPAFSMNKTATRLDTTDAVFVDIIHTNSGSLFQEGLSFPFAIGHVDFWPNGGSAQPGCAFTGPDLIDLASGCSHGRAPIYFTESIKGSVKFASIKCDSFEHYEAGNCTANSKDSMGYPVSKSSTGSFYLKTNKEAPFALG